MASRGGRERSSKELTGPATSPLACPTCHGTLDGAAEAYRCTRCRASFPLQGGIPDFAPDSELYWGELSPEQMTEAIRLAGEAGYEAAARYAASVSPDLARDLLNDFRIDGVFHGLALRKERACLDVGSGWGTLSRALTAFFDTVWSLEIVRERVAFQEAFRAREGLRNLEIVRGSATRLPFEDGSFDLIVANGIIQWVGLADCTRPVPDLQREFLRECWRTLRPGGALVLGGENRFGIFRLLGGQDHSGLPCTNLLPRRLAGWVVRRYRRTHGAFVSRLRGRDEWPDYRTWTHTARGYERLLRRAGFGSIDAYWAFPDANFPSFMGRLDEGQSLHALIDFSLRNLDLRVQGSRTSQFFLKFRTAARISPLARLVLRFLAPDMVFVARREGAEAGATGLDRAVGRYTVRWSGSNKLIWFGMSGANRFVAKVPRFPRYDAEVAEEERALGEHNGIRVEAERYDAHTLYREPYLESRPMDCLDPEDNRRALDWLLAFQERTRRGTMSPAGRAAEIESWLARFDDQVKDGALHAQARAAARKLLEVASSAPWPRVAEHGDLWRRNILFRPGGGLYVIDWQHLREDGDPLFDLALLTQTHWETWRELDLRAPGRRRGSQIADLTSAFCARTGIPPEVVHAYYPYAIARRIVRSSAFPRHQLIEAFRRGQVPPPP